MWGGLEAAAGLKPRLRRLKPASGMNPAPLFRAQCIRPDRPQTGQLIVPFHIQDVLDLMAADLTSQQILEELPYLEPEDVQASLQYAAREIDHPVLIELKR
jgi:hypothetical protein